MKTTLFTISIFSMFAHTLIAQELSSKGNAITISIDGVWTMEIEQDKDSGFRKFTGNNGVVVIIGHNPKLIAKKNVNTITKEMMPDLKFLAISPKLNPVYDGDRVFKIGKGDAYVARASLNAQGANRQIIAVMGYYDIGSWWVNITGPKEGNWDSYEKIIKTIKIAQ